MPTTVYPGSETSAQYQMMLTPYANALFTAGANLACPDEYQPIAVSAIEDVDDIFIEPQITATYFSIVDIPRGGQWIITDIDNRQLYLGRVVDKAPDPVNGTVTYRFGTLMGLMSTLEPAGVLISAEDAGLGATVDPEEIISYLVNKWSDEVPGLTLAPITAANELLLRGNIKPFAYFISVEQTTDPLTIREWLEQLFAPFDGYIFRLEGTALQIIPPLWRQLGTGLAIPLDDAYLTELNTTTSAESIINSQRVTHRPWVLKGSFTVNDDGEPEVPNDLPFVIEKSYYRQGDTSVVTAPEGRIFRPENTYSPIRYTSESFPDTERVRVTWTAYVFETLVKNDGSTRAKDSSQHVVKAVNVFDLSPGNHFDVITDWKTGLFDTGNAYVWVWRVSFDERGVRATLIVPPGNATFVFPIPVYPPGFIYFDGDWAGTTEVRMGAEFHLDVQGQAWEKADETYSATYGAYTPPTLPPGALPPPFESAGSADPQVVASRALYGKRAGAQIDINVWSLVNTQRTIGELMAIITGGDYESTRELVIRTLLDIAQSVVKENIAGYSLLSMTHTRPFSITTASIGRLATYGDDVGIISSYGYSESHTMQSSDAVLQTILKVPQDETLTDDIVFMPYVPPETTPTQPPGYPVGGFPGGEYGELEPVTGTGIVEIDMGARFDLLSIEGPNGMRVRLYRTAAARDSDAARAVGTKPEESIMPFIILDATVEADEFLPLQVIAKHAEDDGIVYANVEGGTATFNLFIPDGRPR